jgi:hypothetical protein
MTLAECHFTSQDIVLRGPATIVIFFLVFLKGFVDSCKERRSVLVRSHLRREMAKRGMPTYVDPQIPCTPGNERQEWRRECLRTQFLTAVDTLEGTVVRNGGRREQARQGTSE